MHTQTPAHQGPLRRGSSPSLNTHRAPPLFGRAQVCGLFIVESGHSQLTDQLHHALQDTGIAPTYSMWRKHPILASVLYGS